MAHQTWSSDAIEHGSIVEGRYFIVAQVLAIPTWVVLYVVTMVGFARTRNRLFLFFNGLAQILPWLGYVVLAEYLTYHGLQITLAGREWGIPAGLPFDCKAIQAVAEGAGMSLPCMYAF